MVGFVVDVHHHYPHIMEVGRARHRHGKEHKMNVERVIRSVCTTKLVSRERVKVGNVLIVTVKENQWSPKPHKGHP